MALNLKFDAKMKSALFRALTQPGGNPRAPVEAVYLTILSRLPTDEELKVVGAYFQKVAGNKWPAIVDLAWALINTPEFLYRH
jgi:hypothetical protein